MGCAQSGNKHRDSTDSSILLTKSLRKSYENIKTDPDKVPELSRRQKEMIWLLWKFMYSDIENDVGLDIFKQILPKSTRIQQVFHVTKEEIRHIEQNGRVISHAKIVKNGLHTMISTLSRGSEAEVADLPNRIRNLGKRHLSVRPEGFTPDLWFLFAEGLSEVIDNWPIPLCHRSETKRVWQNIVCFIIVNMRIGYNSENIRRQSESSATSNKIKQQLSTGPHIVIRDTASDSAVHVLINDQ